MNYWRIDLTSGRCCHGCQTHSTILNFLSINLGRPGLGQLKKKNVATVDIESYFGAPSQSTWLTFRAARISSSEAWARLTSDRTWRETYFESDANGLFFSDCPFHSISGNFVNLHLPTRQLQQPAAIMLWGCGWQSVRRADVIWRLGLKWWRNDVLIMAIVPTKILDYEHHESLRLKPLRTSLQDQWHSPNPAVQVKRIHIRCMVICTHCKLRYNGEWYRIRMVL